jgi:hypothetical protein
MMLSGFLRSCATMPRNSFFSLSSAASFALLAVDLFEREEHLPLVAVAQAGELGRLPEELS